MGKAVKPVAYTLTGTTGSDIISWLGGHLSLNGISETVPANATQVTLSGGGGNDTIVTDLPYGTASQPLFFDGGAGTDTLDLSNMGEAVWVRLSSTNTSHGAQPYIATQFTVEFMAGNGGDPNDPNAVVTSAVDAHHNITNIESLVGTQYNDYLELGYYAGTADGGAGNDRVIGGGQGDHLLGGAGDDFLFGKGGNDLMTGGSGADQFEAITGNGNDVITDFNIAEADSLYIGWQSSTDVLPDASSWQATTWTDASGLSHQAITANFTGGSVTLVDLTLADVANVMSHTTEFHYLNG
jgi:Ca2+-binding RTX toxin-like protein